LSLPLFVPYLSLSYDVPLKILSLAYRLLVKLKEYQ
jgi:hypothetical protein